MNAFFADGIEYRQYDHLYAVSRNGIAFHMHKRVIVEPNLRKDGYCSLGRERLLHRMVATCWLEKPEGSNQVHHINEVKIDNRDENLLWVTPKEHLGIYHDHSGRYERTEITRQKLREYRTGRESSDQTKAKQRVANLRLGIKPPSTKGVKLSAELRATRCVQHFRNTLCEIDGVQYRSFSDAGRALGIRPLTLRKRCISKGFPNYTIVER